MLWNILILLMGKSRYLNIVAIIPARGGSKGIPKKNIQILSILGNSCAGYVIDKVEAIDINDSLDLLWAEFALTHIYG